VLGAAAFLMSAAVDADKSSSPSAALFPSLFPRASAVIAAEIMFSSSRPRRILVLAIRHMLLKLGAMMD
jgi:hypothetical protein